MSCRLSCHFRTILTGLIAAMLVAQVEGLLAMGADPSSQTLSTSEVEEALSNEGWVVVDARQTDAFNGWALEGIERGGHLPGAVDFAANWLDVEIEDRTERLTEILQNKGITRDKSIVIYSTRERDRRRVASFLTELGYPTLHMFDLPEWVRSGGDLRKYPRFHLLVPPAIVKRLLDGELPETFARASRIKFVEASWGNEDASYAKGHVPGSFHVNTDHFEPPPSWYLGSTAVLTKFAADHGFQAGDTVVVSSADVTAAYRLAIVLRYMGVTDVRVLNGGFAAWRRAGYDVDTQSHRPPRRVPFGVPIPQHPEIIVESLEVKSALGRASSFSLVDTRTWAEFIGETSGYKYHKHKGRIPGSIYGQASYKGPNSLSPYRNVDDTMRNADEIEALWRSAGINTETHLCFLCGGGWRAAEVLTFAQVAGKPRTSLYSDGWIGWSNGKNPTETGPVD